ncbi:MAG: hypothetical protein A3J83_05485 [Elusimicrobia bacterium RIFOXYA2_FULL_40_6]|nr:MAG: hypothetical protein A3J83_05485 [Elusimicrobia bacterium RIFOXYA2_FULL_40_6]
MKKIVASLAVLFMLTAPVFAGAVKFNADEAKDPVKFAKSKLVAKAKKLKKDGVKKLVILECFGEYVTSKEVTNSATSQRYSGRWKTDTTTIEFDKDFYTNTSNRVYMAVKEVFEANGIEIISTEDLLLNEKYVSFNLEEEKSGRGASSGLYKPTVVEKSQKVSASGIGIFPTNPLTMIKLVMNLGEITHDIGADGFLQINFKVDQGSKFEPVIDKFEIKYSGNIKETKVGFKGAEKMRYDFMTQWEPVLNLKEELKSTDSVMDGKKGPLNVEKYDKALMDMIYAIVDGFNAVLQKEMSK